MLGISTIVSNIFDGWSRYLLHNNMCRPPHARRLGRHVGIIFQYSAPVIPPLFAQ